MMTEAEEYAILDTLREVSIDDPIYVESIKKIPMPPEFALVVKEVYGSEFIRNAGFNLEKVEAQYGKGWLAE